MRFSLCPRKIECPTPNHLGPYIIGTNSDLVRRSRRSHPRKGRAVEIQLRWSTSEALSDEPGRIGKKTLIMSLEAPPVFAQNLDIEVELRSLQSTVAMEELADA